MTASSSQNHIKHLTHKPEHRRNIQPRIFYRHRKATFNCRHYEIENMIRPKPRAIPIEIVQMLAWEAHLISDWASFQRYKKENSLGKKTICHQVEIKIGVFLFKKSRHKLKTSNRSKKNQLVPKEDLISRGNIHNTSKNKWCWNTDTIFRGRLRLAIARSGKSIGSNRMLNDH